MRRVAVVEQDPNVLKLILTSDGPKEKFFLLGLQGQLLEVSL